MALKQAKEALKNCKKQRMKWKKNDSCKKIDNFDDGGWSVGWFYNSMNERFTFHSQIEHRNLRYTGTGTPDTTKWEYGTNLRRDALSSHLSHFSRMLYFSAI